MSLFSHSRSFARWVNETFEKSDEFSFLMGWGIWAIISTLFFLQTLLYNSTPVSIFFVFFFMIILVVGIPGGLANLWWSRTVKRGEPLVQIALFLVLCIIYLVPIATIGWAPTDENGLYTPIEIFTLIIEMFSMVILRFLYAEIVKPLYLLLKELYFYSILD